MSAYEQCASCSGHGLQNGLCGPEPCWRCKGDGLVIARDEKGRFAKAVWEGQA